MGTHFKYIGVRFHHLTVLGLSDEWFQNPTKNRPNKRRRKWLCKCDCGKEISLRGNKVYSGHTKSCGCKGKILLNGIIYDSYAEAFFSLRYKKQIATGGVLHNLNYPGKDWKYDFFIPSENRYIEVTSFNQKFKRWNEYVRKIENKRKYVQEILNASFDFYQLNLSNSDMRKLSMEMGLVPCGPWKKIKKRFISRYCSVDWSKSDFEIATSLGSTIKAVYASRRKYDKNARIKTHKERKAFWVSLDWDKSNKELVKLTGVSDAAVKISRKRYGHPSRFFEISKQYKETQMPLIPSAYSTGKYIDWSKVDWSLPNRRLAKIYGRTPKTVRDARRRHFRNSFLFPECVGM